jgi:hypothetical protein
MNAAVELGTRLLEGVADCVQATTGSVLVAVLVMALVAAIALLEES